MNGCHRRTPKSKILFKYICFIKSICNFFQTYNLLSEKWFTHASPTLFNSGTNRPQLSRLSFLSTVSWKKLTTTKNLNTKRHLTITKSCKSNYALLVSIKLLGGRYTFFIKFILYRHTSPSQTRLRLLFLTFFTYTDPSFSIPYLSSNFLSVFSFI